MNCRNKINKNKCRGAVIDSDCVKYYGEIPESSINYDNCPSVQDIIEELYDDISDIKEHLDLTNLGKNCISYELFQEEETLKVNEALEALEHEICKLQKTDKFFDINSLDLRCLTTECGDKIETLEELLQILINDKCERNGEEM